MNASARSYENVQAKLYGGELVYSVGLNRALLLLGGLSYSRGIKEPTPASRILDRNLVEIPPLRSRAALRYGNKFFFGEFEGVAVNAQNKVDSDLGELRTPGYAVINLRVGVHTTRLNLAAGVENLLDRYYYEHFSYQRDPFRLGAKIPEPGRSVFLTVAYAF
jgi:iron complex outermembrane receptor protein